jgi:hypothetical protein
VAVSVPLSPLAGLVVSSGPLKDDVEAVVGAGDGDERRQRGELVVVVVLGGVRPGLVGDAAGGVGDAGALLGELQGGLLGVGEDGRLPPYRDQVEPDRGFPACAASLVCASVQGAQPLIWLARIFTSAWVAAGRLDSVTALPAELRYFPKFAAMVVPR